MQTVTVYKFEELTKEAQQNVIDNYQYPDGHFDYLWDDANETIKALDDIMRNIYLKKDGVYISTSKYNLGRIDSLRGFRLRKFIINNLNDVLYPKKSMGSLKTNNIVYHNRITSKQLSNGNVFNPYHSAILIDKCPCALTGTCYDLDILSPFKDFIFKPDNTTAFIELFVKGKRLVRRSVKTEIEYYHSDEGIRDYIENFDEDINYLENGQVVNI